MQWVSEKQKRNKFWKQSGSLKKTCSRLRWIRSWAWCHQPYPKTLILLGPTKRILLSKLASIFDSIGTATAVFTKLKVAMQELWQFRMDSEKVPTEARQKWLKLLKEVSKLNHIRFNWCLIPSEAVGAPKLIMFVMPHVNLLEPVPIPDGNFPIKSLLSDSLLQNQGLHL